MNTGIRARVAFTAILSLAAISQAVAAITEISIPAGSQIVSRPLIDNTWSVASQGGTLSTTSGIGIIVNPTWISQNDASDFALHQNTELGSPAYVQSHVPNTAASTITYKFDRPTIVGGVEIVQHINGVTKVSGLLSGKSIGSVFGPSGDVLTGFVVPSDGVSQVFHFANAKVAGVTFKLTIAKSSHPYAFAFHRAFLLDETGRRIPPAGGPSSLGPVGGVVSGLAGQKQVTCWNVTTGQTVTFTTTGLGWNCEQRGLVISGGNLIEQKIRASK